MNRNRTNLFVFALAALTLLAAIPAAASTCSYDIDFSQYDATHVQVEVTSSCPYTTDRTWVSVDGGGWVNNAGSYVSTIVNDPAGDQTFCAEAFATYYDPFILKMDDIVSDCAVF